VRQVRGKKSRGSFEIRYFLFQSVRETQLDMVVGAELEIGDRGGIGGEQFEELVEVCGRRVVRARRADHVEPLEAHLLLDRAQRVDLAGDTDDGEAPEAARARRFQQCEQRRVAHPDAAAPRHARRLGDDDGHRLPAVVGIGRHREHGVHGFRRQQLFGDARGDARPLRAAERGFQRGAHHAPEGTEMRFVGAGRVAGPAVDLRFQARIVGLDELAGRAAALGFCRARNAAIGAKIARHACRQRRNKDRRRNRVDRLHGGKPSSPCRSIARIFRRS